MLPTRGREESAADPLDDLVDDLDDVELVMVAALCRHISAHDISMSAVSELLAHPTFWGHIISQKRSAGVFRPTSPRPGGVCHGGTGPPMTHKLKGGGYLAAKNKQTNGTAPSPI